MKKVLLPRAQFVQTRMLIGETFRIWKAISMKTLFKVFNKTKQKLFTINVRKLQVISGRNNQMISQPCYKTGKLFGKYANSADTAQTHTAIVYNKSLKHMPSLRYGGHMISQSMYLPASNVTKI